MGEAHWPSWVDEERRKCPEEHVEGDMDWRAPGGEGEGCNMTWDDVAMLSKPTPAVKVYVVKDRAIKYKDVKQEWYKSAPCVCGRGDCWVFGTPSLSSYSRDGEWYRVVCPEGCSDVGDCGHPGPGSEVLERYRECADRNPWEVLVIRRQPRAEVEGS